jgi:DNA invertase Pin-like site-specific DNA recombinase
MIKKPKFVSYLRVSTARQGQSGLGLEAQRATVQAFVASRGGEIIAPEYVEVESGKRNDRPELAKALLRCRKTGATLVIAKLDRLSRNAAFLMTLRDTGVQFVAADLPEANTMTVGIMAIMAQHEREQTAKRTVDALAAAKALGRKLGGYRANAADIAHYQKRGARANVNRANEAAELIRDDIEPLAKAGMTLRAIADILNQRGILTPSSRILLRRHKLSDQTRKEWSAQGVANVIERLGIERTNNA